MPARFESESQKAIHQFSYTNLSLKCDKNFEFNLVRLSQKTQA